MLTRPNGQISGIFTDSDLARLFEQRREHMVDNSISEVMTYNPTTIKPDALLPEAIQILTDRKISELPVVDDQKRPVGLIDITDVMDCMSLAQPTASAANSKDASETQSASTDASSGIEGPASWKRAS